MLSSVTTVAPAYVREDGIAVVEWLESGSTGSQDVVSITLTSSEDTPTVDSNTLAPQDSNQDAQSTRTTTFRTIVARLTSVDIDTLMEEIEAIATATESKPASTSKSKSSTAAHSPSTGVSWPNSSIRTQPNGIPSLSTSLPPSTTSKRTSSSEDVDNALASATPTPSSTALVETQDSYGLPSAYDTSYIPGVPQVTSTLVPAEMSLPTIGSDLDRDHPATETVVDSMSMMHTSTSVESSKTSSSHHPTSTGGRGGDTAELHIETLDKLFSKLNNHTIYAAYFIPLEFNAHALEAAYLHSLDKVILGHANDGHRNHSAGGWGNHPSGHPNNHSSSHHPSSHLSTHTVTSTVTSISISHVTVSTSTQEPSTSSTGMSGGNDLDHAASTSTVFTTLGVPVPTTSTHHSNSTSKCKSKTIIRTRTIMANDSTGGAGPTVTKVTTTMAQTRVSGTCKVVESNSTAVGSERTSAHPDLAAASDTRLGFTLANSFTSTNREFDITIANSFTREPTSSIKTGSSGNFISTSSMRQATGSAGEEPSRTSVPFASSVA